MKKIVKGNDFTLKIPVMKSVEGQKVPFPLPACTDVVVQVCNQFKRIPLAFEIDVKEDNVLLARVEGDKMSIGTYAIEVKGKIFGNDWRSNEYPQFAIVAKNADADTEFGETDEGDNSVEMDTALVILPPSVELQNLITKAEEAIADTKKAIEDVKDASSSIDGSEAERAKAEKERVGEEGVRIESEKKRVGAEQSRIDAEGKRVLAEEARVLAEKKREIDFSNAKSECETATDNANTAAVNTNEAIRKCEVATAGAEKVNANLTDDNVVEITDRTGTTKSVSLDEAVKVGNDVTRIKQTLGAYSDREDIVLTPKETNKAISSDGVKVPRQGWAIAEFTAEKGNEYLFKPNVIDGSVCVFAEYITSIETRGIDYTYTYNEDGTIATATATYLGKTHVYTYEWTVEAGVNTPTIKEDDAVINNLPMTYETKVGTYSPLVKLNEDAELPIDGYCRYMSHFKGNSSIKIVVSYKIDAADLVMKVVRDGVFASISTQLGNLSQKEDETRKKIEELHKSYVDLLFESDWDYLYVDGKNMPVIPGKKMRVYPKFRLQIGYSGSARCPLIWCDMTHLDTSKFTRMDNLFIACTKIESIDMSNLNTSNVTNMRSMFAACKSVVSINISGLDTSNVTDMNNMFSGCPNLEKITGLPYLVRSSCRLLPSFDWNAGLTKLNLREWNTTNVVIVSLLFYSSGHINYLDMTGDNIRFPNLTREYRMFSGLPNNCKLKLGKYFFDAPKLTSFHFTEFYWEKESMVLSLVTNLFDRKAAGQPTMTITLDSNSKKNLSEEQIAAITAKGYIIA